MLCRVHFDVKVEADLKDPIFQTLRDIHAADPMAVASGEQYEEAINLIEQRFGIPFFVDPDEDEKRPLVITSVYEVGTDVPVLEA